MGQDHSNLTVNGVPQTHKSCRPCGDWGKKDYNTVKVDAATLRALGKENAAHANILKDAGGKDNAMSKEEQENSRKIQEWEAKQEEMRRAEEQRREMERRVKEEQERQQAEQRRREAELRRLQLEQEAKERDELERRRREHEDQLRHAEMERSRQEEQRLEEQRREEARLQKEQETKKVHAWLQANGFKGPNDLVRKKISKVAPLQVAVQQNAVEMIGLLIAAGADPSKVNGKNESALTVAQKANKKGSHATIIQVLATYADMLPDAK